VTALENRSSTSTSAQWTRIPLPPLPEQRRIAEILDKADALQAKRRAALAQLDTLTQVSFLDMFGDPATNPKGWAARPLGSEIESVRYGTGSPPEYIEEGVPFVRATNVKDGTIISKDLKRISIQDAENLSKCRVHFGNLIVVRSGVNTGDCAVVPREYDGACAAFDLIVDLASENAVFYNFLINSPYGKRFLSPLTRRAAQPHLNADQLRNLVFIAPPQSLKEKFARRVAAVEKLKTLYRASLAELNALFASLQYRAFRAEL
jgi:type I restriction enzyme S subunit